MSHGIRWLLGSLAACAYMAAIPAFAQITITVGSLTLPNAAAVPSGTVTFASNSTIVFGGSFDLGNAIVFNGGVVGTFNTNGYNDGLTGILSGAGRLAKIGAGTLTLTGNNTFSGGTTLSAGTLAVGSNGALGTGALTFSGGTLLGGVSATLANRLNLSGSITFAAASGTTLDLNNGQGWNVASGTAITFGTPGSNGTIVWRTPASSVINTAGTSVNLAGGTLKVGDASFGTLVSALPSFSIGSGATLDLDEFDLVAPASLSGAGRITTLSVGATPTLTTRGGSFGGTIDGLVGLHLESGNLTLTGRANYTGDTAFEPGQTLTFNSTLDSELKGPIFGAGTLAKQGTGTLTLSNSTINQYSGGTILSAGTLAVKSNGALGTGALTFSGGTLSGIGNASLSNRLVMSGNITFAAASGTTLDLNSSQAWSLAANSSLTFGMPGSEGTIVWRTPAGSSVAAGGSQSVTLANGTLKGGDDSFGLLFSNLASLNVASGATLDLNGFNVSGPANLTGSGRITSSSLNSTGGAPTFTTRGGSFGGTIDGSLGLNVESGNLTLAGASYTGGTIIGSGQTLTLGGGADSILSGTISGAGSLSKQGTGTLTLTGTNTFSGGTMLSAGTLAMGNGKALGTGGLTFSGGTLLGMGSFTFGNQLSLSGNVTIGAKAGTTLSIAGGSLSVSNGTTLTIGSAESTGRVVMGIDDPANVGLSTTSLQIAGGTLRLSNSVDSTFSGVISGVGQLEKNGAGTLALTGNNTFSGGTTLSAGTLAVGSSTALGTGALTFSGGTLLGLTNATLFNRVDMSGNIKIAAATGTTLFVGGGPWSLQSGTSVTIGGSGLAGTVMLMFPSFGSITSQATQLNIAGGTFRPQNAFVADILTSHLFALTVGAGATLDLAGSVVTLPTAFGGSGQLTSASGAAVVTTRGGGFAGVIDGSLGLNVLFGNFVVTGAASYTGGTGIASGQTLIFDSSANSILSGVISGAGALATQGTGTLTLTGNNTFSGGTTVGAGGTLQVGNGVAGGRLGDVANAGRLLLDGGAVSVGTVSQHLPGSVVNMRSGTVSLTGSGITADNFIVGDRSGGDATFNLATGKTLAIGAETIGNAGNGTFTQSGGTHTATFLVLGSAAGSNGTFNLNGGSFTVGSIALGLGTSTLNLNGGMFNYTGDLQMTNLGIGIGVSYAGSAISVAGALTNFGALSASGRIDVDGSLDNSGTITLSGITLGGRGALVNNNLLSGFGTIGGSGGFTNYGQVQTAGGGMSLSNTGTNVNAGNWDVTAGQPLVLSGATLSNVGAMNLNGGLISGSGTLDNAGGGLLTGRGTISANFSNAGELGVTGGALAITKAFANSGLIDLRGGNASLTGGTLTNTGIVQGAGAISSALVNAGTVEAVGGTLLLGGAVGNGVAGLMTAGAGTRLVISQGLASNAGIIQLAGGTFDNNAHALANTGQMSGFGTFRASTFTNSGRMTFGGGNTVVNGEVTNQTGGRLEISYNPATFTGNVVNNGFVKTTATNVTWAGSFTNNGTYLSDPSTQVFQDITLGTGGALQGGVGDVFVVTGNMVNNSQANALFDLSQANLSFTSGAHTLVWSGANLGASRAGYDNNFAIGIFELRTGGSLALSGAGALPSANALYVHSLVLGGGLAQVGAIQSGLNIYYDPLETANAYLGGATYDLAGGGHLLAVAAVPEPETYVMWLAGLMLMGGIAHRRRVARRRQGA